MEKQIIRAKALWNKIYNSKYDGNHMKLGKILEFDFYQYQFDKNILSLMMRKAQELDYVQFDIFYKNEIKYRSNEYKETVPKLLNLPKKVGTLKIYNLLKS
jgi:hypothetical protein